MVKKIIKILTIPLIVVFTTNTIALSAPDFVYRIRVPEKYGRVEERWRAPEAHTRIGADLNADKRGEDHLRASASKNPGMDTTKPRQSADDPRTVIILQDAHENFGAQKNIAEIIQALIPQFEYNKAVIGIEGAIGDVSVDTLKKYPIAEARKQASEKMVKEGYLTGTEHAAIASNYPIKLWGIEDEKLFYDDFKQFYAVASLKSEMEDCLDAIDDALTWLKQKLFNSRLKEFDALCMQYEKQKIPFHTYIEELFTAVERNHIDIFRYTQLALFKEIILLEASIDKKKLQQEMVGLSKTIRRQTTDNRQQTTNVQARHGASLQSSQLYNKAIQQGIDIKIHFPTIQKELTRARKYALLDMAALISEVNTIAFVIQMKLARTHDEEKLVHIHHDVKKLEKVITLRGTRGDVGYVFGQKSKEHRAKSMKKMEEARYAPCAMRYAGSDSSEIFSSMGNELTAMAQKYGYQVSLPQNFPSLDKNVLASVKKFYSLAEERESAMLDNLLTKMETENKHCGVLVAGGYHSEGIARMLKEKNISYVTITPHIHDIADKAGYMDRMLGNLVPLAPHLTSYITISRINALAKVVGGIEAEQKITDGFTHYWKSEVYKNHNYAARLKSIKDTVDDEYVKNIADAVFNLKNGIVEDLSAKDTTPQDPQELDDAINAIISEKNMASRLREVINKSLVSGVQIQKAPKDDSYDISRRGVERAKDHSKIVQGEGRAVGRSKLYSIAFFTTLIATAFDIGTKLFMRSFFSQWTNVNGVADIAGYLSLTAAFTAAFLLTIPLILILTTLKDAKRRNAKLFAIGVGFLMAAIIAAFEGLFFPAIDFIPGHSYIFFYFKESMWGLANFADYYKPLGILFILPLFIQLVKDVIHLLKRTREKQKAGQLREIIITAPSDITSEKAEAPAWLKELKDYLRERHGETAVQKLEELEHGPEGIFEQLSYLMSKAMELAPKIRSLEENGLFKYDELLSYEEQYYNTIVNYYYYIGAEYLDELSEAVEWAEEVISRLEQRKAQEKRTIAVERPPAHDDVMFQEDGVLSDTQEEEGVRPTKEEIIKGKNIAFISFRLNGLDGVSQEANKWKDILHEEGANIFYYSGETETTQFVRNEHARTFPPVHFLHKEVLELHEQLFKPFDIYTSYIAQLGEIKAKIKEDLRNFITENKIDVLITENVMAYPGNFALGEAVIELQEEFLAKGIHLKRIDHNHDFAWERARFQKLPRAYVETTLQQLVKPTNKSSKSVVLNSFQKDFLWRHFGVDAMVGPNVMEFEKPPAIDPKDVKSFRDYYGIGEDDWLFLLPVRPVERKQLELAFAQIKKIMDKKSRRTIHVMVTHESGDEGSTYWPTLKAWALEQGIHLIDAGEKGEIGSSEGQWALGIAYTASDMVFFTSLIEGWGNALIEAVYYKKPICVYPYSVYKNDIKPFGIQTLEVEKASDTVADGIIDLLHSPKNIKNMVDHNYKVGKENFSYDNIKDMLRSLIFDLYYPEDTVGEEGLIHRYEQDVMDYLDELRSIMGKQGILERFEDRLVLTHKNDLIQALHMLSEVFIDYYKGAGCEWINHFRKILKPRDDDMLKVALLLSYTPVFADDRGDIDDDTVFSVMKQLLSLREFSYNEAMLIYNLVKNKNLFWQLVHGDITDSEFELHITDALGTDEADETRLYFLRILAVLSHIDIVNAGMLSLSSDWYGKYQEIVAEKTCIDIPTSAQDLTWYFQFWDDTEALQSLEDLKRGPAHIYMRYIHLVDRSLEMYRTLKMLERDGLFVYDDLDGFDKNQIRTLAICYKYMNEGQMDFLSRKLEVIEKLIQEIKNGNLHNRKEEIRSSLKDFCFADEAELEQCIKTVPDFEGLASDIPFDEKRFLYRGRRASVDDLRAIAFNGVNRYLMRGIPSGKISLSTRPENEIAYAFNPRGEQYAQEEFFSVIYQIEESSIPIHEDGAGLFTEDNIPPEDILKIWFFNKKEKKFIEISSLINSIITESRLARNAEKKPDGHQIDIHDTAIKGDEGGEDGFVFRDGRRKPIELAHGSFEKIDVSVDSVKAIMSELSKGIKDEPAVISDRVQARIEAMLSDVKKRLLQDQFFRDEDFDIDVRVQYGAYKSALFKQTSPKRKDIIWINWHSFRNPDFLYITLKHELTDLKIQKLYPNINQAVRELYTLLNVNITEFMDLVAFHPKRAKQLLDDYQDSADHYNGLYRRYLKIYNEKLINNNLQFFEDICHMVAFEKKTYFPEMQELMKKLILKKDGSLNQFAMIATKARLQQLEQEVKESIYLMQEETLMPLHEFVKEHPKAKRVLKPFLPYAENIVCKKIDNDIFLKVSFVDEDNVQRYAQVSIGFKDNTENILGARGKLFGHTLINWQKANPQAFWHKKPVDVIKKEKGQAEKNLIRLTLTKMIDEIARGDKQVKERLKNVILKLLKEMDIDKSQLSRMKWLTIRNRFFGEKLYSNNALSRLYNAIEGNYINYYFDNILFVPLLIGEIDVRKTVPIKDLQMWPIVENPYLNSQLVTWMRPATERGPPVTYVLAQKKSITELLNVLKKMPKRNKFNDSTLMCSVLGFGFVVTKWLISLVFPDLIPAEETLPDNIGDTPLIISATFFGGKELIGTIRTKIKRILFGQPPELPKEEVSTEEERERPAEPLPKDPEKVKEKVIERLEEAGTKEKGALRLLTDRNVRDDVGDSKAVQKRVGKAIRALIEEGKIRNTFAKQIVDEELILRDDVYVLDGEGELFIYRDRNGVEWLMTKDDVDKGLEQGELLEIDSAGNSLGHATEFVLWKDLLSLVHAGIVEAQTLFADNDLAVSRDLDWKQFILTKKEIDKGLSEGTIVAIRVKGYENSFGKTTEYTRRNNIEHLEGSGNIVGVWERKQKVTYYSEKAFNEYKQRNKIITIFDDDNKQMHIPEKSIDKFLDIVTRYRQRWLFQAVIDNIGAEHVPLIEKACIIASTYYRKKKRKGEKRYLYEYAMMRALNIMTRIYGLLEDKERYAQTIAASIVYGIPSDALTQLDDEIVRLTQKVQFIVDEYQFERHEKDDYHTAKFINMLKDIIDTPEELVFYLSMMIDIIPTRSYEEMREVVSVLAQDYGLYELANEIRMRAYIHHYSEVYEYLKEKRYEKLGMDEDELELYKSTIMERLYQFLNSADIKIKRDNLSGRVKSYVSIDEKIKYREAEFDDIKDFVAFRIIAKDIDDIWNIFAVLLDKFQRNPSFLGAYKYDKFKDFISRSLATKSKGVQLTRGDTLSGYQSLHLAVMHTIDKEIIRKLRKKEEMTVDWIEKSFPIEIQIRTEEMDKVASSGPAAETYRKALLKGDKQYYMEYVPDIGTDLEASIQETKRMLREGYKERIGNLAFILVGDDIVEIPKRDKGPTLYDILCHRRYDMNDVLRSFKGAVITTHDNTYKKLRPINVTLAGALKKERGRNIEKGFSCILQSGDKIELDTSTVQENRILKYNFKDWATSTRAQVISTILLSDSLDERITSGKSTLKKAGIDITSFDVQASLASIVRKFYGFRHETWVDELCIAVATGVITPSDIIEKRGKIQDVVRELNSKQLKASDETDESPSGGFIHQGIESMEEFMRHLDEVRTEANDITEEYKGKIGNLLLKLESDQKIKDSVRGEITKAAGKIDWENLTIYGIHSIIKKPTDFFLGWFNDKTNELFLSLDLIEELEKCGVPSLVEEYILHELLCQSFREDYGDPEGHYKLIHMIQQEVYSDHYPDQIKLEQQTDDTTYKGLLGERVREYINRCITTFSKATLQDLDDILRVPPEAWKISDTTDFPRDEIQKFIQEGRVYLLKVSGEIHMLGIFFPHRFKTKGEIATIEKYQLWEMMDKEVIDEPEADTQLVWLIGTVPDETTEEVPFGKIFIDKAQEHDDFKDIYYLSTFSPIRDDFHTFIKDLKKKGIREEIIKKYGIYLYIASLQDEGLLPYLQYIVNYGYVPMSEFIVAMRDEGKKGLVDDVAHMHVWEHGAIPIRALPFKKGFSRDDGKPYVSDYTIMYGYKGFESEDTGFRVLAEDTEVLNELIYILLAEKRLEKKDELRRFIEDMIKLVEMSVQDETNEESAQKALSSISHLVSLQKEDVRIAISNIFSQIQSSFDYRLQIKLINIFLEGETNQGIRSYLHTCAHSVFLDQFKHIIRNSLTAVGGFMGKTIAMCENKISSEIMKDFVENYNKLSRIENDFTQKTDLVDDWRSNATFVAAKNLYEIIERLKSFDQCLNEGTVMDELLKAFPCKDPDYGKLGSYISIIKEESNRVISDIEDIQFIHRIRMKPASGTTTTLIVDEPFEIVAYLDVPFIKPEEVKEKVMAQIWFRHKEKLEAMDMAYDDFEDTPEGRWYRFKGTMTPQSVGEYTALIRAQVADGLMYHTSEREISLRYPFGYAGFNVIKRPVEDEEEVPSEEVWRPNKKDIRLAVDNFSQIIIDEFYKWVNQQKVSTITIKDSYVHIIDLLKTAKDYGLRGGAELIWYICNSIILKNISDDDVERKVREAVTAQILIMSVPFTQIFDRDRHYRSYLDFMGNDVEYFKVLSIIIRYNVENVQQKQSYQALSIDEKYKIMKALEEHYELDENVLGEIICPQGYIMGIKSSYEPGVVLLEKHWEVLDQALREVKERSFGLFVEFEEEIDEYILITSDGEGDNIHDNILRIPFTKIDKVIKPDGAIDRKAFEELKRSFIEYGLFHESPSAQKIAMKAARELKKQFRKEMKEKLTFSVKTVDSPFVIFVREVYWRLLEHMIPPNTLTDYLSPQKEVYYVKHKQFKENWDTLMRQDDAESSLKAALLLTLYDLHNHATVQSHEEYKNITQKFVEVANENLDLLWNIMAEPIAILKGFSEEQSFDNILCDSTYDAIARSVYTIEDTSIDSQMKAQQMVRNEMYKAREMIEKEEKKYKQMKKEEIVLKVYVHVDFKKSREYTYIKKIFDIEMNRISGISLQFVKLMSDAHIVLAFEETKDIQGNNVVSFTKDDFEEFMKQVVFFHYAFNSILLTALVKKGDIDVDLTDMAFANMLKVSFNKTAQEVVEYVNDSVARYLKTRQVATAA